MDTDTSWALVTLLVTAIVGLLVAIGLIVILSSRSISTNFKRAIMLAGLAAFLGWMVTVGNPRSDMSLEEVYKKKFSADTQQAES
ncbi:MAG: hypothetical protein AB1705_03275 [Verrucomicrobiota bacterium]